MSNEIKQGDTVRVSKDAPKMYVPVSFWTEGNSIVEEIHEGNAAICYESNYVDFRIVVPIKYLLVNVNGVWKKPKTKPKRTRKVDAEAKEAKFKKGDKVRFKKVHTVVSVDDGQVFIDSAGNYVDEDCLEPYIEPTEQTEAEGERVVTPYGYGVVGKDIEGRIAVVLEKGGFCGIDKAIKIIADKTDFDWDAYAADLVKEVALKVANKYNSPHEAAEYAVSVAKAVVEGLKRK